MAQSTGRGRAPGWRTFVYVFLAVMVAVLMARMIKGVRRTVVLSGPLTAVNNTARDKTLGRVGVFKLKSGRWVMALKLDSAAKGALEVVWVRGQKRTVLGRLSGGRAAFDIELKIFAEPRPGAMVLVINDKGRALYRAVLRAAPGR